VATIVVLGWRAAPHLLGCLRSISRIDRSVSFEVIVVLNEPIPELSEALAEHVVGIRVIHSRVNLGFGGACNAAAQRAEGQFIVLLNDDTLVDQFWLTRLVETIESRPIIAAVGSLLLNTDGTVQESGSLLFSDGTTAAVTGTGAGVAHRYDWARRVDYCSGASLLIRKSTWIELGGFDETYFPAYFEDVDLCLRIQELGQQVWLQPLSRVWHIKSASVEEGYKVFLSSRNRRQIIQRWSRLLEQRLANVGTAEETEEASTWVAMGRPKRLLLIDDRIAVAGSDRDARSTTDAPLDCISSDQYFVSFFPTDASEGDRNDLCRLGVRIIEGDLASHLKSPYIEYDVVIISGSSNYRQFAPIARKYQPMAQIVYYSDAIDGRPIERMVDLDQGAITFERWQAEEAESEAPEAIDGGESAAGMPAHPDREKKVDLSPSTEDDNLENPAAESERGLHDIAENSEVLDNEVRCLLRERAILHEYIATLETDLGRLANTEQELSDARQELDRVSSQLKAYQNRLSRVIVDQIVVSLQRYPRVYRIGRSISLRLVHRFRR
jgi:GT2 family glycosyltransferase